MKYNKRGLQGPFLSYGMASLTIVCGLPGVGKTTVAQKLAQKTGGTLLRTDVVRKEAEILGYSKKEKQQVYKEMFLRAEKLLAEGEDVILDATFAKGKNRLAARKIAEKSGVNFKIIEVVCPEELVKKRLFERKGKGDESEAEFKHYLEHKKTFESIKEKHTIIDSSKRAVIH